MNAPDGKTAPFGRLVVLADSLAPSGGAPALAVDWAWRLRLPVYALEAPWLRPEQANEPAAPAARRREMGATAEADDAPWVQACARHGVRWELARWASPEGNSLWQILEPEDLLIFSHALPPDRKKTFLRESLRHAGRAVLICTDSSMPVARVLLLHQGGQPNTVFLTRAAQLCAELGARAVVLTVARSERLALQQQQAAREALACCALRADFDLLVGTDVRAAVAHVARWRGCRLVLMQQQDTPAWWRWLRGGTAERLLDLTHTISVLALRGEPEPRASGTGVAGEAIPFPQRGLEGEAKGQPAAASKVCGTE